MLVGKKMPANRRGEANRRAEPTIRAPTEGYQAQAWIEKLGSKDQKERM
jgi:hypothetical protein